MPSHPVVLIRVAHHSPSLFNAPLPPHATLLDHVCDHRQPLDDAAPPDPAAYAWRLHPSEPLAPSTPAALADVMLSRAPAHVYLIVPSVPRAALEPPDEAAFEEAVSALRAVSPKLQQLPRVSVLVVGVLAPEHHPDYITPLGASELLHGVTAPAVLRARLQPPTPPPLWSSSLVLPIDPADHQLTGLSLRARAPVKGTCTASTAAQQQQQPPGDDEQPPVLDATTPARVHSVASFAGLPPLAAMQGASAVPVFELCVAPDAPEETRTFCTAWGASKTGLLVAIGAHRLWLAWQTDPAGYPSCAGYAVRPLYPRAAAHALDDAAWLSRHPAVRDGVDVADVPAALRALPVTDLPARPSIHPAQPDPSTPSDLAELEIDPRELDECLVELAEFVREASTTTDGDPGQTGSPPGPAVRKRPRSPPRADTQPASRDAGDGATTCSPRALEDALMRTRERAEGEVAAAKPAPKENGKAGLSGLMQRSRRQATTDSSNSLRRQRQARYMRLTGRGAKPGGVAGGGVAGGVTVSKTSAVGKRVQSVPTRAGAKRMTPSVTPRDLVYDRRRAASVDADLRHASGQLAGCDQFYILGDLLRGPDARDAMHSSYLGGRLRDVDDAGECTDALAHMTLAPRRRGMHGVDYAPDVIPMEFDEADRPADDRIRRFEDAVSATRCEFGVSPHVVGAGVLDKLKRGLGKLNALAGGGEDKEQPSTAVVAVKKAVATKPGLPTGLTKEMVLKAIGESELSKADLARIYQIAIRSKG